MASRNEELLECILNGGVPTGEPKSRMEAYLKEICEMGGVGGGGGKNCRIIDIVAVDGGNQVTFAWTNDDGTQRTRTMFVANGEQGVAGADGVSPTVEVIETDAGHTVNITDKDGVKSFDVNNGATGADGADGKSAYEIWLDQGNTGTEQEFLNSLKGADGTMTFADLTDEQKASLKGDDGFSPNITENADNTEEVYKLDIETKDGTFTTPNLKGAGATGGSAESFIVNAEFTTDDDGKWVVSNVSKTFADISQAIADKENVELHVYPQGVDNTAYVLIPNMVTTAGIAFNLVVAENTSLTGFTVMILPDNTVNSSMTDIDTEVDIIDDTTTNAETTWSSEKINAELNDGTVSIVENGEVKKTKITKGALITEYTPYTDRNGKIGYNVDELNFAYDTEQLARAIENWLTERGITLAKSSTYNDLTDIYLYSPSAVGAVYMSTKIVTDGTAYLGYKVTYSGTDYVLFACQYDYDNLKVYETSFNGLSVFNLSKIIPDLAGCYIQQDILDLFHNWFYLQKAMGFDGSINIPAPNNINNKTKALLTHDEVVSVANGNNVGAFDLGNIVALMTSPLQKLVFTVSKDGSNLGIHANNETSRTSPLSSGLFGPNLLAPKNTFATLDDMSTLPKPPNEALGIYTVKPNSAGQPGGVTAGGTLIVAHITDMLYSQSVNYIGTRVAVFITTDALYYQLGKGGQYYPTASWTGAWRKIASTAV